MMNTPSSSQRYSRHLLLPGVGPEGQRRLGEARVLLIGAGGLGSPTALYLAGAGVGTLGLVDGDRVSLSNLQRQILYTTDDCGESKVEIARKRLLALNPEIHVETYPQMLNASNATQIIREYDLVVDGTDNFQARYLVSRACIKAGKPHLYAGIFRFEGQVALFSAEGGPCYQCLYPVSPEAEESPNCSEAGVLGPLPGMIGSLQALETLKWILKLGSNEPGLLFAFDALGLQSYSVRIPKRVDCPTCSEAAQQKLRQFDLEIESSDAWQLATAADKPADAVWLDVRTDSEFAQGSLTGAVHIPLSDLDSKIDSLDRAQTYAVYCQSGQRSVRAQALLKKRGFKNVWNLERGLNAEESAVAEMN